MSGVSFGTRGAWRRLGVAIAATALIASAYLLVAPQPGAPRKARGADAAASQSHVSVRVWRDIRYAGSAKTTVDVYRPRGRAGRLPGVLVVHGGAWVDGDKARMRGVSTRIARSGLIAYSVNYTLARSRRPGYPRQVRELREAVRWARRGSDRFGLAPRRLGALGTSAGGHLVSLLAADGRGPLHTGARLRAVAAWSPPLDFTRLMDTRMAPNINTFLGCLSQPCPGRQSEASPITHVSPDDPPVLIVNSRDEQVPASQARRMADRLSTAGVPNRLWLLAGSAHAMEYADRAIDRTIEFLRRGLRRRDA